ncbi:MAG: hypothetical protein AB9891_09935 [Anaerolineaceae bacterium]
MTILLSEIRLFTVPSKDIIFNAADRRITISGKFHSLRQKIFKIPYLNACVGYYGLAQLDSSHYFSEWLPNFIYRSSENRDVEGFTHNLLYSLNKEIDKNFLHTNFSGFHVCGFDFDRTPKFFHINNEIVMTGNLYSSWTNNYITSEILLTRNNSSLRQDENESSCNIINIYYCINGDVRPFHSIWERLDNFVGEMVNQEVLTLPNIREKQEKIVKWKLTVISSFYSNFAKKVIIGRPIDVISLIPN